MRDAWATNLKERQMLNRRTVGLLLSAVVTWGLGSGFAWAAGPKAGTEEGLVPASDLARNGLQRYWTCRVPLHPKQKIVRAVRLDENLYLQADSGDLFCVHAQVGILRWAVPFAPVKDTFWPPAHNSDREDMKIRIEGLRKRLADADELRALVLQGVQANPRLPELVLVYLNKYQPTLTEKLKQLQQEQLLKPDGKSMTGEVENVRNSFEQELSQLFTYGEIVTFGTQSYGVNFDLRTGALRNKMEYGFAASCAPASDGLSFFVAGADNRFFALSTKIGASLWQVKSELPITAHPVYHQDRVFWVDGAGMLMSSKASQKTDTWQVNLGGKVSADMAHTKQGLFIGSSDQALYQVNDTLGKTAFTMRVNGPIRSAPAVTDDYAYVPVVDVGFHVARLPGLKRAFIRPDLDQFVAQMDKKTAYLRGPAGALEKTSLSDGQTLDALPVGKDVQAITNVEDAAIYLVNASGAVECLKPDSVPFLKVSLVEAVPNLSVAYTRVVESGVLAVGGSAEARRDMQDMLRPEPKWDAQPPREEWLSSADRNLPASGAIDRSSASGQPGAGGGAAKPETP